MPIKTETYRRETPTGSETIKIMASIDNNDAEIRVIQKHDGKLIADTIPHWGNDPDAGHRWVEQHRNAYLADGYLLVEDSDDVEE